MSMQNDEFYIGWMQQAPSSFGRFVRNYLLLLLLLVVALGVLLALNQKKFADGRFEYGKLTELSGTYLSSPVPHLVVDKDGEAKFIPLVGYGKHGAEGIIRELEQAKGTALNGRNLRLQGTLIQGQGKTLLQVDKNENPLLQIFDSSVAVPAVGKEWGQVRLNGEVVDPKCYFGVMKPGEGKVHKDCAIRCISGGIPPVLSVPDEKGGKRFVLLVGANGERLNEAVKDFVAVPSRFTGELVQYQDWLVMRVGGLKNKVAFLNTSDAETCATACCKKDR